MKKKCSKCKKLFPKTEKYFRCAPNSKLSTGIQWCSMCFKCEKKYRDKMLKSPKYKATVRNKHLQRKYGISENEYQILFRAQKGRCGICFGTPPLTGKQRLNVDHNHSTGKIRGLLCISCNLLLGRLENNLGIIPGLLSYLEK